MRFWNKYKVRAGDLIEKKNFFFSYSAFFYLAINEDPI